MIRINTKTDWDAYCAQELAILTPVLLRHGYVLDQHQPHLQGERYLMHAITTTSGYKLILLGRTSNGDPVVIKATRDYEGIREINHERMCRKILSRIDFARDVFHTPQEIAYIHNTGFVVCIQEYIDQTCSFLERPLAKQFTFALVAFKGQEGAHATTYKHIRLIRNVFGIRNAETYLTTFVEFKDNITEVLPQELSCTPVLSVAFEMLTAKRTILEQYSGFLTHTDFVPHNFRIHENTLYLLDHSSLTFGNKYEGWARFINFMALYNPPLQKALELYVEQNRTPEERVALELMRVYRLAEIIWYYTRSLERSTDNLLLLNKARIQFWCDVLQSVTEKREVPESRILSYQNERDTLRSSDEKRRQQGLH